MTDDAEGIIRPEPIPFYKNKTYITLPSCFCPWRLFSGKGTIGLGRQRISAGSAYFIIHIKYMPE
ncbi:MAG: hypothetical protein IPP11_11945 [Chitinophagaceae bacterium]|nr:hypothetical protein [Chitinophagaceae bacterium]